MEAIRIYLNHISGVGSMLAVALAVVAALAAPGLAQTADGDLAAPRETVTAGVEPLYGDSNGDGTVDLDDFAAFADCLAGPEASLPTETIDVSVGPGIVFSPKDVTIELGDTIHWFWSGGTHNVESGVDGSHDGAFRSGNPTSNSSTTFDFTFDAAFLSAHPRPGNVYPYYCVLHEGIGMVGSVTVAAESCTVFDGDEDGDVDLEDFHRFQQVFQAP